MRIVPIKSHNKILEENCVIKISVYKKKKEKEEQEEERNTYRVQEPNT